MKKNKFICYDDTELQGYLFEVDNPKGVVQIAHGMQEYSKTYFKFAQFLNKKGYIVYMIDQRGHGKSCKNISELGKVKGDIFNQTVADQLRVSEMLFEKYNKPIYFIGHSYGSFIGQKYLTQNKHAKKIILIGSAYMKTMLVRFAKLVANLTCLFKGKDANAKLIEKLSFESYKKSFDNASWITSSSEETDAFYSDELNGTPFSAGFYKYMFSNQLKLYKNLNLIDKNLPIGIFSGGYDPVGDFGKSVCKLFNVYNKNNLNVSLKIYSKMRHGILQEINKQQVFDDILKFIENEE